MANQHLGAKVECSLLPGKVGTVVYVEEPTGTWRRGEPTFEVIWDDLSCTRRVAREAIQGPSWTIRADLPRVSPSECARMWHEYQLRRIEESAKMAAERATCPAAAPSSAAGMPTRTAPARPNPGPTLGATDPASAPRAREISAHFKQLLSGKYPSMGFAVHCERRVLTVSWMDGPLPGAVFKALEASRGQVDKIVMKMVRSESAVQAAINYCLRKVYEVAPDCAEATRASLNVTPQEYECGGLANMAPPTVGPAAGLSWHLLVRCVLDRWDAHDKQFVYTKSTAGLLRELRAMFPHGELIAAQEFCDCQDFVHEGRTLGQRAMETLRA